MADLTATVITYNEEKNIQACLESLTWAKEIVVVDSGSSDRTLEICRGYTDKIFDHPWVGFIEQKNCAVSLATYDWILNIDADERVSEELRHAIECELAAPRHDGYWIARRNYFLGRWIRHGGWYPDRVLRLFDRRTGRFGGVNPHAYFIIPEGSVGFIDKDLIHYTYQNLSQYLHKQDSYSGISASERVKWGRRSGSITQMELLLRAMLKFVQVYLLKRGFLDGMHGWIVAAGASYFNVFKYAKVWEAGFTPERIAEGAPTDGLSGSSIHGQLWRLDAETQASAESAEHLGDVGWIDVAVQPLLTFVKVYLYRQACRNGLRGLVDATMMSFHTFVRLVKAWELLLRRNRPLE
jgi:glycosyltransferase involved in cell wall biosynthesis